MRSATKMTTTIDVEKILRSEEVTAILKKSGNTTLIIHGEVYGIAENAVCAVRMLLSAAKAQPLPEGMRSAECMIVNKFRLTGVMRGERFRRTALGRDRNEEGECKRGVGVGELSPELSPELSATGEQRQVVHGFELPGPLRS